MPVLPEVASRMILSRVKAPDRSPSSIIRNAGRSFTEPPGFFHSAFAYSSTFRRSVSNAESRINGVLPIKSTMDVAVRGRPGMATGISDWDGPDYNARRRVRLRAAPVLGGTRPTYVGRVPQRRWCQGAAD